METNQTGPCDGTAHTEMAVLPSVQEVVKLVECAVCRNIPFPPIPQCVNGHTICNACRVQLIECPVCKAKFSEIRSRTLENLVLASTYICSNRAYGCPIQEVGGSIWNHIRNCEYRPFMCPATEYGRCGNIALPLSEAYNHFLDIHKAKLYWGPSLEIVRNISLETFDQPELIILAFHPAASSDTLDSWRLGLIQFDGSYFLSEVFARNGMLCWVVSHIGPDNSGKQYRVRITCKVTQADQSCNDMKWGVPVYPIRRALSHKASPKMAENNILTPSCRLYDLKKMFQGKLAMQNRFDTHYLLSRVG